MYQELLYPKEQAEARYAKWVGISITSVRCSACAGCGYIGSTRDKDACRRCGGSGFVDLFDPDKQE